MPEAVIVVGTLDSKGPECAFVRDALRDLGVEALVMDVGVQGEPTVPAHISREQVATAGGRTLADLRCGSDRQTALRAMGAGAASLMHDLLAGGQLAGAFGLGGSGGTGLAAQAMSSLPLGFPRLIVSTVANLDTRPYVGFRDIVMVPSVVDLTGLNRISRHTLRLGAAAMAGMVRIRGPEPDDGIMPTIAITAIGLTTPAATVAQASLKANGYEVIVFHATGTGGDAMEALVAEGKVDGVLDLTLVEVSDAMFGGAGPSAAARPNVNSGRAIPRVVAPGGLDMIKFGPATSVPAGLRERRTHAHSDSVTLVRVDADQARALGHAIGAKLAAASDPVRLLIPLRGLSEIDRGGRPFDDPGVNEALFEALRRGAGNSRTSIIELDRHINDPSFGERAAAELMEMMRAEAKPIREH